MTSLERHFRGLVGRGRKILSVYVTAGVPTPDSLPVLVQGLAAAGADALEIGIPFSDPLADGPVIQAAHSRAIRNGVRADDVLRTIGRIRKNTSIPIILMTYANTIMTFGCESFIREAASAGASGVIVPDLPPEEGTAYRAAADAHDVAAVLLIAPTTPDDRIASLAAAGGGFLYGVSTLGVTGVRDSVAPGTLALIDRIRAAAPGRPLLVGFGISGPSAARTVARHADGVIVGSAVVARLLDEGDPRPIDSAVAFVASLRTSLDET